MSISAKIVNLIIYANFSKSINLALRLSRNYISYVWKSFLVKSTNLIKYTCKSYQVCIEVNLSGIFHHKYENSFKSFKFP